MRYIVAILVLILIVVVSQQKPIFSKMTNIDKKDDYFQCRKRILNECQVPTLGEEKCFFSHYYKCPRVNGSYKQCTDNYWSYDGVCRCQNRTFEMCPSPYKISARCYQEKLKKCPSPLTNKERGIMFEPCRNPRINMYHGNKYNKMIDNGYVLY